MIKNTFQICSLTLGEAEVRAVADRQAGFHTLIGAIVRRDDGRLFSQRRSMTRSFGPGLWDNVGGHVEDGETLLQTLVREMREETGWALGEIIKVIAIRDWVDGRGPSREYIVLCNAKGDLDRPVLEVGKVDQFEWFTLESIQRLGENRPPDDASHIQIYDHAFRLTL